MGVVSDVLNWVTPQRKLPPRTPDNATGLIKTRGWSNGEIAVINPWPSKQPLADEESYFVACNPQPGIGIAHAIVTAFSATSGLFAIKNTWDPADPDAKTLWLDYLRLLLTAAPTAGVSLELAVALDDLNRAPTAGDLVLAQGGAANIAAGSNAIVNPNSRSSRKIGAEVHAFSGAAQTIPAPGPSVRYASRLRIPTGINVVGDVYKFMWGQADQTELAPPLTAIRAAQPALFTTHGVPVGIGPGKWCVIHRWSLTEATAAPSYEYELALVER